MVLLPATDVAPTTTSLPLSQSRQASVTSASHTATKTGQGNKLCDAIDSIENLLQCVSSRKLGIRVHFFSILFRYPQ